MTRLAEVIMGWLNGWFGRGKAPEPLLSRIEYLPGIGEVRIAYVVNCIRTMCPRPQLLTMKILSQVQEGEVIEVVSDNPAAVESFPSLAETLGCAHLLTVREQDCWRIFLRKGFPESVTH